MVELLRSEEEDQAIRSSTIINMLSIPGEQQVCLKIQVAEVNRNALRRLGSKFEVNAGNLAIGTLLGSSISNFIPDVNTGVFSLEGGSISVMSGDVTVELNALRRLALAKTLAEPNLVTLNGRSATFRAGDTFSVPVAFVNTGGTAQSVQQEFVGVSINFTPTITDKDRIRLNLNGTASTRDDSAMSNVGDTQVPGTQTRDFRTNVEMREGETLALAGLITSSQGSNGSRVPGIGDLPGIGRLFATDDTSASEQELLILVTPHHRPAAQNRGTISAAR